MPGLTAYFELSYPGVILTVRRRLYSLSAVRGAGVCSRQVEISGALP